MAEQQTIAETIQVTVEPVKQTELGILGDERLWGEHQPFDPVSHDLPADFRLTRFADLRG